jgi:peptidoglycan/LPS O-acetylase OafA/YrhL
MNSATRLFAGGTGEGAGAPYLGIAVLAVLLTGCWLVDRHIDMPIRRKLSRIVARMQALRAEL